MTDLITELHALAQRMAAAGETDEPVTVSLAAEEIERLQRELDHQKLIHLGFTNNTQIEDAKQIAGSFYPSTDNDNWIPVYMLAIHAHRCGPDSETFCHVLQLEQKNGQLQEEVERLRAALRQVESNYSEALLQPGSANKERNQLKAQLESERLQAAATGDLEYANGAKRGFEWGQHDDNAALAACIESRVPEAVRTMKEIRQQAKEAQS